MHRGKETLPLTMLEPPRLSMHGRYWRAAMTQRGRKTECNEVRRTDRKETSLQFRQKPKRLEDAATGRDPLPLCTCGFAADGASVRAVYVVQMDSSSVRLSGRSVP